MSTLDGLDPIIDDLDGVMLDREKAVVYALVDVAKAAEALAERTDDEADAVIGGYRPETWQALHATQEALDRLKEGMA